MTKEELDKIVEQHQHWINEDCEGWEGMRANLRDANLRGANLSDVDLRDADLRRTDLRWANLNNANLSNANLYGANLSDVDLRRADLREADLRRADLRRTDLRWTNLSNANLYGANLSGANEFRLGKVLDKPLTGYKKTKEGVVITAKIPIGAIVFCINGRKCRTNRAKITDMDGHEILHSSYDNSFEYRLGQEINIKDFSLMYNVECASGFHFFKTRKEAKEYCV